MGDHELTDPTRADAALDVAAVADRLRGEQEDVRARLASMTVPMMAPVETCPSEKA